MKEECVLVRETACLRETETYTNVRVCVCVYVGVKNECHPAGGGSNRTEWADEMTL